MASTGQDMGGNQIFISIKRGKEWPPTTFDLRVKYEETIAELKQKAEKKCGVPVDKMQLFWHGKEMIDDIFADKTLLDLNLHTGFSLNGYDLREEPDYWPPVEKTEKGLQIAYPKPIPLRTRAEMGYTDGLTMDEAIAKYREPGARW